MAAGTRMATRTAVITIRMGVATSVVVGITIMINIVEAAVEVVRIIAEVEVLTIIITPPHRRQLGELLRVRQFLAWLVLVSVHRLLRLRVMLLHRLATHLLQEAIPHLQCRVSMLLRLDMAITVRHLVWTVHMIAGEAVETTEEDLIEVVVADTSGSDIKAVESTSTPDIFTKLDNCEVYLLLGSDFTAANS